MTYQAAVFVSLALVLQAPGVLSGETAGARGANIAVLDLTALGGLDAGEAQSISDRLRGELLATGAFTVIERGLMDAILREQGFQQSGACDDASCIVEVGQLLAVHQMVGGSIGRIGRIYSINLKVIDVETGRIERQLSEDIRCGKEALVSYHVRQLARRMAQLDRERRSLTSRWYFWAPIGVMVAGAGVLLGVLAGGQDAEDGGDTSTRSVPLDGSYQ